MTDLMKATQVPRELRKIVEGEVPTYRAIYNRIVDGLVPAENVNGIWHVHRSDIPAIARIMCPAAKIAA